MAHKHSVYDTDIHFIIDPITRKISSESGKVTLMQNDHNSERFTFQIPRYIEGHDMSLCNVVQVHYINTNSSNKREKSEDIYDVKDLQVSPDSDDIVIGSWLISQNATKYGGTLHFTMRFACVVDLILEYQWFTDIYKVISIADGIYNIDVATNNDDTDLLESWKEEILANTMPYVAEIAKEANNTLAEVNRKIGDTEFIVNFDTGEVEYVSPNHTFKINTDTGNLEWSGSNEPVDAVKYPMRRLSGEKSDAITSTVDGEFIVIEDSANDPIRGLRVFGRTEQKQYTDGVASPNPDYPQELESVENVSIRISGGNLFDKTTVTDGYRVSASTGSIDAYGDGVSVSDYIEVKGLNVITISGHNTAVTTNNVLAFFDSEKNFISGVTSTEGILALPNATYDIPESAKYVIVNLSSDDVDTLMINAGETALSYESCKGIYKVNISRTLSAIPVTDETIATYIDSDGQMWLADEIDFSRGVYIQRVANRRLLASDSWSSMSAEGRYWLYGSEFDSIDSNAFCTHFTRSNDWADHTVTDNTFIVYKDESWNDGRLSFNTEFISLTEWQTFLKENEVYVIYQLTEPVYTQLDDNELEYYLDTHTHYPISTVMNDSNVKMELIYNVDLKSYVKKHGGGADWNVNDPNESGYVANRTHWVEDGLVEVLPETTVNPGNSSDPPSVFFAEPIGLVAGNTYIVDWNGVEYECYCVDLTGTIGVNTAGIGNLASVGLSASDEPFTLVEILDESVIAEGDYIAQLGVLDGSTEVTFSISVNNEIVHQIPKKFIPSAGDRAQSLIEITLSDDLKTGTTNTSFDTAYAMDVAELQSAIQIKSPGDNPYYFSVVAVQKELYMNTIPRILFTVHEHTDVDRQFFVRMFRWNSAGIDRNDDYSYLKYGYVPIDGENGKILQQSGNSWKAVFPTQIIMTASDDDSKLLTVKVDSNLNITVTDENGDTVTAATQETVVNFSTEDGENFTADKTYYEIKTAYEKGQTIKGILTMGTTVAYMELGSIIASGSFMFRSYSHAVGTSTNFMFLFVSTDNVISFHLHSVAITT